MEPFMLSCLLSLVLLVLMFVAYVFFSYKSHRAGLLATAIVGAIGLGIELYILHQCTAHQEEKWTDTEIASVRRSLIVEVDQEDPLLLEYKAQKSGAEFDNWFNNNMGRIYLNISVLSEISKIDCDRFISWIVQKDGEDFHFNEEIDYLELEKRLISVNPKGEPICERLLQRYMTQIVFRQGRCLDTNLCKIIISDPIFNQVHESVVFKVHAAYLFGVKTRNHTHC